MTVTRIVLDRKLLDGFKKRALKKYPNEYMEVMLGEISRGKARIFSFQDFDHSGTPTNIITDDDACHNEDREAFDQPILGSLHTHPNGIAQPSELDLQTAAEDGEKVWGICAISKRKNRRYVSWGFFDTEGQAVELILSE